MIASGIIAFWSLLQKEHFKAYGQEAFDRIQAEMMTPSSGLFVEERTLGKTAKDPVFNWGLGVLIQAANAASVADKRNVEELQSIVEGSDRYWNKTGPVAGFDVRPVPKPMDRYYDDNEWMVLGLIEASKILHSDKVLDRARKAFDYVLSGRDSVLGDGIYWREKEKTSKNTCSNGPAAACALALYDVDQNPRYLQIAEDIYAWTRSHLRDPEDGLYWDNISLSGKVQKSKWSYNTGLMLRSAADLYRITQKPNYAADAIEMQDASLRRWVTSDGRLKDDGKFIHLLLENWIRAYSEVPKTTNPWPAIESGLKFVHGLQRDSLGHYGNRWDMKATKPYTPYALIDQASAIRAFFTVANADQKPSQK